MLSKRVVGYFDLARPVNVVITLLAIPVASVLAGARANQWVPVLLAALTGGLVAAGANSINDYFDVEIDKINKPLRPIPRGDVTRKEAWIEWLTLSAIAIVLNLFLNLAAFAIALFAVFILYWYSAFFKRTIFAGNVVVAVMAGMAFVYGAAAVGNPVRAIVPSLFAFLVNLVRELIKDIEDMEGDRKEHANTLPVKYGPKPALWIASVAIIVLIGTTIAAYQFNIYNAYFLYLVAVVDVLLVAVMVWMWKDQTPSTMNLLSNGLKVCMVVGLAAIYLGSP